MKVSFFCGVCRMQFWIGEKNVPNAQRLLKLWATDPIHHEERVLILQGCLSNLTLLECFSVSQCKFLSCASGLNGLFYRKAKFKRLFPPPLESPAADWLTKKTFVNGATHLVSAQPSGPDSTVGLCHCGMDCVIGLQGLQNPLCAFKMLLWETCRPAAVTQSPLR